jgi:hypothetical protein
VEWRYNKWTADLHLRPYVFHEADAALIQRAASDARRAGRACWEVAGEGEVNVDIVVLLLMMNYTQHTFAIKARFGKMRLWWNHVAQPTKKRATKVMLLG